MAIRLSCSESSGISVKIRSKQPVKYDIIGYFRNHPALAARI
jgi:hypothetical protein